MVEEASQKRLPPKATGALLLGCSALFAALATTTTTGTSSSSSSHDRFPADLIGPNISRVFSKIGGARRRRPRTTTTNGTGYTLGSAGIGREWTHGQNEEKRSISVCSRSDGESQGAGVQRIRKKKRAASERADATEDAVLGEEGCAVGGFAGNRIHSADVLVIVQINSRKDHEDFAKIQRRCRTRRASCGVT